MITTHSEQSENAAPKFESGVSKAPQAVSENQTIAALLSEISSLLANQGAGEFRVHAYRNASRMLAELETPVRDVLEEEGVAGLVALPTIGRSIATLIQQYVHSGRMPLLHHLRGDDKAERVFATLPMLGPELSRRIHEHLEIETLPELMRAVQDGRLEQVPGIGRKRAAVIGECLAQRLRRSPLGSADETTPSRPDQSVPVSELLDIDAEYRRLASQGKLPKIAPRKFNPASVAWLPILHTHRGERHYTALYSNTARAHQLNTTKDWVVIYRDDSQSHGRWTVITSQFGKLRGWRIIRGREDECSQYYIQASIP
jgi:hypothetical protein